MLDPGPKPFNQRFYYRSWNKSGEFRAERKLIEEEDDSEISSPPLWRTSPQHGQNNYINLSPASRTQAIARGQKELMEMVSKMPEGCYELSLKDIVEQSIAHPDPVKKESFGEERSIMKIEDTHLRERDPKKRSDSKKVQISRSGSLDNGGFLLKMVIPIAFSSKKKKKKKANNNNNGGRGRVSPRPSLLDGSGKGRENEWWRKRITEAEEGESGRFSSNSGSSKSSGCSSSRSSSRNSTAWNGWGGCWGFIFRSEKKGRNVSLISGGARSPKLKG